MRPLSVAMVSASFHPVVGGAERQALELSVALAARGLSVRVLTRRLAGLAERETVRGVPVERLWCAGGGALAFLGSLSARLWAEAPSIDAVHVHLAGSPALACALVGRLRGKRVFVKLGGGRGIGELAAAKGLGGWLKRLGLHLLRPQFVAVAKDLRDEAEAYLGRVPMHVIPNGVDVRRFRPLSEPERLAARRALGWPGDAFVFLYVGRLSPEKRLAPFLEAWAQSARKVNRPLVAAFVGQGSEEAAIRSAARSALIEDRLRLHAFTDEVAPIYGAADVFVLPSVSEGLSNALLEAMACGLPALASRVGGTPEAVEDARTGFLFAVDDADDLRRQLDKLLVKPQLARQMGQAARTVAVERYSLEQVAKRYEELYRWAL